MHSVKGHTESLAGIGSGLDCCIIVRGEGGGGGENEQSSVFLLLFCCLPAPLLIVRV